LKTEMQIFGILHETINGASDIKDKKKCNIVVNTHGDILFAEMDMIYMHYPIFAILRKTPANIYSSSPFWRAYFVP